MSFLEIILLISSLASCCAMVFFWVDNAKVNRKASTLKLRMVREYLVQHCNKKTNYEMIIHVFNPDGCVHCKELRTLMLKMNDFLKS